ncbi:hypothetical protein AB0G02_25875 [Actinosynnema sp. NPDC023658]|uniref:hypothetical protein n=1 Tax=Actinosynnema sp. NPDC023658 TaxID=3155465 RepID=UPI0033FB7C7C
MPPGDAGVSTTLRDAVRSQFRQCGGGSGLSGLHGHSVLRTVVVVVVVGGGAAGGSGDGGGAAGGVVVVVVGTVVVELRCDVNASVTTVLGGVVEVVVDGRPVIQVEAGVSACRSSFTPSMYTPMRTPVSADAATAKPHVAHSTRTASLLTERTCGATVSG